MSTTIAEHASIRPAAGKGVELPRRTAWLIRGFYRYADWYVRKHFHAVRLSNTSALLPTDGAPLLVVLNHPSWWDPMIGVILSKRFAGYDHYPAIDAVAVEKYRIFTRLGFFGVDTHSLRGAAVFLRTASAILSAPHRAVWVTAQGRFTDVRTRPLGLQSGVGHVAARMETGSVIPVALEYCFWTERTPEALVRIGRPIDVSQVTCSARDWTSRIEEALTETLDELNTETMSRDPARFTTLLAGRTGVGGSYDLWRRVTAWARGRRFDPSHGDGSP
jgi:1-acyl-sn-glycerol-3-phosphate acyltransferase